MSRMETTRQFADGWDRRIASRPLATSAEARVWLQRVLGLAVLVATLTAGYMVAGVPVSLVLHHVPAVAEPPSVESHIKEAARRYDISAGLIAAIIEAESEFNPRAVSPKGAQGLMQLMPATAAALGVRDPFDPRENIDGGVRHLRGLMDRFDNNVSIALAAYNAGEKAVIDHRGVPPYRETRAYVRRIIRRSSLPVGLFGRASTNS